MVKEVEKWLVSADSSIQEDANYTVFISDYGIDFYTDFNDLIEVIYLYMLPKAIGVFQNEINKIKSLEQAQLKILDFINQILNLDEQSGKKRKQINEFMSKIENKTNETITLLKKECEDYENIFNELNSLTESTESTNNSDDEKGDTITEIMDKMNLYQRMNAYFVLALYAIIDIYCLLFYQDSLSKCPKDQLYHTLNRKKANPIESLNAGLDIHKKKDFNLKKIREKIIKKLGWEIHQESFINFKDIRRIPAHQRTVLTLEELKEKFPKQQKVAEEIYNQVIEELDETVLPPIILKPLLEGIEDLKIGLYLREIGNSCLRYLVLNESILQYHLYKDRFIEKTEKIVSDRENS